MQVFVKAKTLRAALLLAGKKDIRFYLNAVRIEAWPNETRVIATDGHKMGVFRDLLENEMASGAMVELTVPRDVIESLRIVKKDYERLVTIDVPSSADGLARIGFEGAMRDFKPEVARYPDYRRVIPDGTTGEVTQFNIGLLSDMAAAAECFTGSDKIRIRHNGPKGALVTGKGSDFVGVVMPFDFKTEAYPAIDWAKAELSPLAQAA